MCIRGIREKITHLLLVGCVALLLGACGEPSGQENAGTANNGKQEVQQGTSGQKEAQEEHDGQKDSTQAEQKDEKQESQKAEELTLGMFSKGSGVYAEAFELVLDAEEKGDIYYTLDGSDPTTSETAVLYENPIAITDRKGTANVVSAVDPVRFSGNFNYSHSSGYKFECKIKAPSDSAVEKGTVVRAVVKNSDGSFGDAQAATYFIGTPEEYVQGLAESCAASGQTLAVISLAVNYEDFFDSEKGIYVKGDTFQADLNELLSTGEKLRDGETARSLDANYKQKGREWERVAHMTMFEFSPEGTVAVLNQQCGVRIQGNYSRSDLQKGLRLYARKEYGDNNFRYAVFGEEYKNDQGEVMDKFKNLVLRNGGNCAFTSKFNDAFWQSLVRDTAVETKQSRPCIVYLNGEYWGLYVLEEDYTDDYFEDLHGVNKDDVVVYKGDAETYEIGYSLDEGEIPEGESVDYYFRDLIAFFDTHSDLKAKEDYEAFVKLVDPQSVMDYFAVQCWINNKWDWPGKNWSMWRTINTDAGNAYADGRWRFVFYDVEFGGVSGSSDARTNTIREDNYKPKGLLDMDTENPAVLCFAYLMTNEAFRQEFCDKLLGLSEGLLEKEAALERLEEFEAMYGPLYKQFFDRYPGTGNEKDALNGGYATSKCIRDFLGKRDGYIQKMVDYCNTTLE